MNARIRRSPAWVVARAELWQLRHARDFWLPLTIVASLFFVVLPAILLLVVSASRSAGAASELGTLLGSLPDDLRTQVRGDPAPVQAAYALAVSLFAPLAIVVPLTVSSAIGSHSIVGERERGTGEFLAHSPATERQVYAGKLLASIIPGYGTALVGFGCYSLVVNVIVGPKVGGWFFPTASWWALVLWVLPPFIALALGLILAISARVSSPAAAQQASALATLPLIAIAFAVATSTMTRGVELALGIGVAAWCVAAVVLWRASRALSRERLLGLGR